MEETFIGTVQLLIKPPRKLLEEGEKLFRTKYQPENTADISRLHHWFPREMTSENSCEKGGLNFHTDDAQNSDLGSAFDWLKQIFY